ncbi:hypothetical protein AB0B89_20005 [Sphaerisporangium sp. NPDC049002]|uniref:hypothetical protein n=1 Tax=Sphaerisporangium sp. NPDC049002 TaxID=3155392 RepID=UPI003405D716
MQLSPTLVAWDGYEEDLAETLHALRTSESGRSYHAAYNAWLRQNGIEQDTWDWLTNPEHVLSLIPRAMQPNADRVPPNVRFVGPCLDPGRLADTSWTPPEKGGRVLLVSFGTAYNDQLGVGRHLPAEEVTAAALRSAVESIAGSAEVAARLAEIRTSVRSRGGADRAADVVESYLR